MLKNAMFILLSLGMSIVCVRSDGINCDLKTGEGCEDSEGGFFRITYKQKNTNADTKNTQCNYMVTYTMVPPDDGERYYENHLYCSIKLEDGVERSPRFTVSGVPKATGVNSKSAFIYADQKYVNISSRRFKDSLSRSANISTWSDVDVTIESELFVRVTPGRYNPSSYDQRIYLSSGNTSELFKITDYIRSSRSKNPLYIAINTHYSPQPVRWNNLVSYRRTLGGGVCHITCYVDDTWAS